MEPIRRDPEEWRRLLEPEAYSVLREGATTPPRGGAYSSTFMPTSGHFVCKGCGLPLYTAGAKFPAQCGWPSFAACFHSTPAGDGSSEVCHVTGAVDLAAGRRRLEARCARCEGHLGHVFHGDKQAVTCERHCINSAALVYREDEPALPERWLREATVAISEEVAEALPFLRRERAAEALQALRQGYSDEGLQEELRGLEAKAGGDPTKRLLLMSKALFPTQLPILKRFGFSPDRPGLTSLVGQIASHSAADPAFAEAAQEVQKLLWQPPSADAGAQGSMVEPSQALTGRMAPMEISARHFVLGTPMRGPWPRGFKVIVFANGCFWGSEKGIWRLPGGGIHSTAVGYAGGFTPNPSYEEVCSGKTGHTEAVQVVFDPAKIGAVDILRWFWESHDPTQGMAQGNDRGTQYRSGLYYFDDDQRQLFEASKAAYEAALRARGRGFGQEVTTEIRAASDFPNSRVFYYGEDHHQQYLAKPGARPYCSAQPQQVSLPPFEQWAPAALRSRHEPKLSEDFWAKHGPTPHCVIRAPTLPIVWP